MGGVANKYIVLVSFVIIPHLSYDGLSVDSLEKGNRCIISERVYLSKEYIQT